MIVWELMSDPLLSKYSIFIVDEAYEWTLHTDLLIVSLKTIQKQRNVDGDASIKGKGNASSSNPLKIVIMSAMLDVEKFSKFFHKCVLGFFFFSLGADKRVEVLRFYTSRAANIK